MTKCGCVPAESVAEVTTTEGASTAKIRVAMGGAIILEHTWQQAAIFFVLAGFTAILAILQCGFFDVTPTRRLGTLAAGVFSVWMGAHLLTSSTRIDSRGVTMQAPLHVLQQNASIAWSDMAAAEIIPCGFHYPGLRLLSRRGTEIIVPLDQLTPRDVAAVISRISAHPSVRPYPDARTFYAQADRVVPARKSLKLRARIENERVASIAH